MEDPAVRQPGAQHRLFYPTLSVFQIHRLWSRHGSFKFNTLCSLRYFLASSVILTVSLWSSLALFTYSWDCGQQCWTQHFNSGCAIIQYMHVADSALIQYYTIYAANFGNNFARSSARSKNSYLGNYSAGSPPPQVLFRGADSQNGVSCSLSMVWFLSPRVEFSYWFYWHLHLDNSRFKSLYSWCIAFIIWNIHIIISSAVG